jgi:hypothetical protein
MLYLRWVGFAVLDVSLIFSGCGGGADTSQPSAPADDSTSGSAGASGTGGGSAIPAGASGTAAMGGAGGEPSVGSNQGSGGAASHATAMGDGGGGSNSGMGGNGNWTCPGNGAAAPTTVAPSSQTPGTWKDVTPVTRLPSSGTETILVDPARPSDIYVNIDTQGTWRSTDYGLTFKKASTGQGDVNNGRQWYGAIDKDPCRDPMTGPPIYVTQGFAATGLWKSTDFGVNWINTWDNNIFLEDGTTNVAKDVGADIHSLEIVDPKDPNHLIASLHGYWGTGNHNGVFETKDGGKTWIDHDKTTFHFVAHSDLLFSITPTTWMVSHGIAYPGSELHRSTDSGTSWTKVATMTGMVGRHTTHAGSAMYADGEGLWKSTDEGVTWAKVPGGVSRKTSDGMWTSATKLYVTSTNDLYDHGAELRWAAIGDDSKWTSIPLPPEMWTFKANIDSKGGTDGWTIFSGVAENGVATFDGTHTIIVTCNHNGGVWRYVEP